MNSLRSLLVLAEQEADLAPAHADVAGRNVGVGSDVAEELGHEALAEAHDFVVALALRVEVRTALAAAHRQRRQRVLEDLLEGEELQDAEVDRRVEAQPALVRPDGAVHLDPESAVDPVRPLVVLPRHPEHEDALGLDDPLEDLRAPVFRPLLEDELKRLGNLLDRLVKLGFGRVLGLDLCHQILDVHGCGSSCGATRLLPDLDLGFEGLDSI